MLGVIYVTLRENTEWVETLHGSGNNLVGADREKMLTALNKPLPIKLHAVLYLGGSSRKIQDILNSSYWNRDIHGIGNFL